MPIQFSAKELDFVNSGGNLWYVRKMLDDGWTVFRWSTRQGHQVVYPSAPSEEVAEERLWSTVRPSSLRSRTTIYHGIARPDSCKGKMFPNLE